MIDEAFKELKVKMLHLKEEYCNALRCLECAVGNAILKSKQ